MSGGQLLGECIAPASADPGCVERCGRSVYGEMVHGGTPKALCCSTKCRARLGREKRRQKGIQP